MKVNAKTHDEITTLLGSLNHLSEIIEELRDTEQDKFDNHSEEWQDSADGQATQSNADELDTLASELQDLVERIDGTFEL